MTDYMTGLILMEEADFGDKVCTTHAFAVLLLSENLLFHQLIKWIYFSLWSSKHLPLRDFWLYTVEFCLMGHKCASDFHTGACRHTYTHTHWPYRLDQPAGHQLSGSSSMVPQSHLFMAPQPHCELTAGNTARRYFLFPTCCHVAVSAAWRRPPTFVTLRVGKCEDKHKLHQNVIKAKLWRIFLEGKV